MCRSEEPQPDTGIKRYIHIERRQDRLVMTMRNPWIIYNLLGLNEEDCLSFI